MFKNTLSVQYFSQSSSSRSHSRGGATHNPTRRNSRWRGRNSRRSGIAILYTALGLAGFLGATALVVDMGNLYTRRAQAQRAADAAALAGATFLPDEAAAKQGAREYAKLNGYDTADTARGTTVTPQVITVTGGHNIKVMVQRREPLYFLPAMEALLGGGKTTSTVGATAVAEKITTVPARIDISPQYGIATGVVNPSIFGPYGRYNFGDPYSPRFLADGTPNTAAPGAPGQSPEPAGADFPGYEYELDIASDYASKNGTSEVQVEIFDPDCYSADGVDGWDEIREPQYGSPSKNPTTTLYTLKDGTGKTIAEATYSDDPESDNKWTTPPGFKFDSANHPKPYKLFVKSLDGASENGFQLRAGKPHDGLRSDAESNTWNQQYNNGGSGNGTKFWGMGKTPMNFRQSGDVTFDLGFVPGHARGGTVYVDKFDTDVGSQSVTYKIKQMPGQVLPNGQLASDGQWAAPPDALPVPISYPEGGSVWTANYVAGAGDTSCWKMRYTYPNGSSGVVRLVD